MLAAPYLLVATFAWGMATGGATSARDMTIVAAGLVLAYVASGARVDICGRSLTHAGPATGLLLLTWLVIDGPLRSGVRMETVRMPALVLLALLCVAIVRHFDDGQRAVLIQGLIVLGTVHAVIPLAWTIRHPALRPVRVESLLGNPNALGVVLLATVVLTTRELHRRRTYLVGTALACQSLALLLTGSRVAIVTAFGLLAWYLVKQASWRTRVVGLPWVVLACLAVTVRSVHAPPGQRLHLWAAAMERIAAHPFIGYGPTAEIYDSSVGYGRPTTHAHNEVLQWTVDYGLIGLVLATGVLVLAVRNIDRGSLDPWVGVAAGCVLVVGMTDVGLRVPVLALMAATLLTAVVGRPIEAPAPHTAAAQSWISTSSPFSRFMVSGGRWRCAARGVPQAMCSQGSQRSALLAPGGVPAQEGFLAAGGRRLEQPNSSPCTGT